MRISFCTLTSWSSFPPVESIIIITTIKVCISNSNNKNITLYSYSPPQTISALLAIYDLEPAPFPTSPHPTPTNNPTIYHLTNHSPSSTLHSPSSTLRFLSSIGPLLLPTRQFCSLPQPHEPFPHYFKLLVGRFERWSESCFVGVLIEVLGES